MTEGLFELPAGAQLTPEPVEKLSAGQRRTLRQRTDLAAGRHPLGGPLHTQAAPHDNPDAPGRRCGNCAHRAILDSPFISRSYPKCVVPIPAGYLAHDRGRHIDRTSHSAASDCRAWWPGCTLHVWGHTAHIDTPAPRPAA